jgi:hypothetical protein
LRNRFRRMLAGASEPNPRPIKGSVNWSYSPDALVARW